MKVNGLDGTKVLINVDELMIWYKIHTLLLDASSRSKILLL